MQATADEGAKIIFDTVMEFLSIFRGYPVSGVIDEMKFKNRKEKTQNLLSYVVISGD